MSYLAPTDLADALQVLSSRTAKIVAGGTDFYPSGQASPEARELLDLTRVEALNEFQQTTDGYRIGAAVTWDRIAREPLPPYCHALQHAARQIGSRQIQNAATIGGNLCNASPAADGVPPLLALDAEVEICRLNETRRLPLESFILGPGHTALDDDEILRAVHFNHQPGHVRSVFSKLGSRKFLVISIAMTAVNLGVSSEGKIDFARIAVGACSPVARRMKQIEAQLIGTSVEALSVEDFNQTDLHPIDDVRASAAYRVHAAAEQILRAVKGAAGHE